MRLNKSDASWPPPPPNNGASPRSVGEKVDFSAISAWKYTADSQ